MILATNDTVSGLGPEDTVVTPVMAPVMANANPATITELLTKLSLEIDDTGRRTQLNVCRSEPVEALLWTIERPSFDIRKKTGYCECIPAPAAICQRKRSFI